MLSAVYFRFDCDSIRFWVEHYRVCLFVVTILHTCTIHELRRCGHIIHFAFALPEHTSFIVTHCPTICKNKQTIRNTLLYPHFMHHCCQLTTGRCYPRVTGGKSNCVTDGPLRYEGDFDNKCNTARQLLCSREKQRCTLADMFETSNAIRTAVWSWTEQNRTHSKAGMVANRENTAMSN